MAVGISRCEAVGLGSVTPASWAAALGLCALWAAGLSETSSASLQPSALEEFQGKCKSSTSLSLCFLVCQVGRYSWPYRDARFFRGMAHGSIRWAPSTRHGGAMEPQGLAEPFPFPVCVVLFSTSSVSQRCKCWLLTLTHMTGGGAGAHARGLSVHPVLVQPWPQHGPSHPDTHSAGSTTAAPHLS